MTLIGLCALQEDSCCNQRPLCTRTDFPWPIHTSASTAVHAGEGKMKVSKIKLNLSKQHFLPYTYIYM